MNAIQRYLNRITSPEGCTAVDAMKLRAHNHDLAIEGHEFRCALDALVHNLDAHCIIPAVVRHPKITAAIEDARRLLDQAVEREL